eukprot:PITA_09135
MFSSDEWDQSNWSKKQEGKELKKKIYEETFWRKASEVVKLAEPLVKVLRLVDGKKLAMGFIYEAMDQAKEQIKAVYKDRVAKYGPIWAIIDERWNNQLHRPIHAAGYFLNPRYHYKAKEVGALRGEVRDGLIDCIDRMIPLESDQLEVHKQVTTFSNAAAQWWEAFGGHVPELQVCIHILSQTCSAELVRNHLLNKRPDSDPIVLEDIDPTSDWVVESCLAEFDPDKDLGLDIDLEMDAAVQHVQLNADPSASVSQPARTPASSSQPEPRQKRSRIAALSQRASTGTTSTVAVGDDDDEEEPWAGGSDSDDDDDPEIDRHDLGSSGSSYGQ